MISTFSIPAFRRLPATNSAARWMSGLCSGSVLMLGIRTNSFNSASRRSRFSFTKASVAEDMVLSRPLYGGDRRPHAVTPRTRVIQDAAHLGLIERLCDQVVGAHVEG